MRQFLSWPSPDGPRAVRIRGRALALAALLLCAAPLWAATPPNTSITNTATASFSLGGVAATVSGSATLTTATHTPSQVQFLQYVAPGAATANAAPIAVSPTQCSASGTAAGPFVASSGPAPIGGATIATPKAIRLAPTTYYGDGDGEPVFVQVTDLDQNLDPAIAETILLTITTSSGDSELLRLTETGLSTGVFTGYIQTSSAKTATGDCQLSVAPGVTLTATYVDVADPADRTPATALVDPFGLLFDSSSGAPVSGASVSLLIAASLLPASVFCDDGVTPFPATVLSGTTVSACGGTISQPAGRYRFPRVAPGTYQLKILPPTGYTAPSTVATGSLQSLPGAPFNIVIGSREEAFALAAGVAVRVDVPMDAAGGGLQITKTAGLAQVGIGDYLPYTLTLLNSRNSPTLGANIVDVLPPGFRFQSRSARLNGIVAPSPVISADGRTLNFAIGTIASNAAITLSYVVQVTPGARIGAADNVAAAAAPLTSNTAHASVVVHEDLMQSKAILTGRVIVGPCADTASGAQAGLLNARIFLEDGSYVLTDKKGFWHLDNIRPGTHVVQLDLASLPKGYEVLACEHNDRFAGRSYSQFVNVRGGTVWQADFHVAKQAADADLTAAAVEVPAPPALESLVEVLPYDAAWLATAAPKTQWLHPQTGFQPALPAIKIALQHHPKDLIELKINGAKVSALNYDGMLVNAARTTALSSWSGVTIHEGDNSLQIAVRNAEGAVLLEETRSIHYAGSPARAIFDPQRSNLAADGKTRPVIAVRFLDKDGHAARRGVVGEFQVNSPYQAYDQRRSIELDPLGGNIGGRARYQILDDGTALIELTPTTKAGEVILGFAFNGDHRQEVRTWLSPAAREWILVGFAEGSVGQKTLSGNMEALNDADADKTLFDENRVAFYAKGQIKGGFLLTMAYDSAKPRGTPDAGTLKQAVDPNQYYTLYADATDPQFDAASTRKVYLRIEKQQFYALFGDFDTGLTVTELSRYSRTVNGAKSEFHGKLFNYNAFATRTAQAYVRDEIQGDGTSGLYRLSQSNIMINSDKVHIEVRDRFQSQVIVNSRDLTAYLDYDLDPVLGTLLFKEPVPTLDSSFNPVFIVAEYETQNSTQEKLTYGGRGAFDPTAKLEVGLSDIHEGNEGDSGNLTGADLTYKPDAKTTVKAEFAHSNSAIAGASSTGDAWIVQAIRQDDNLSAKIYDREQELGFGLGQQSNSQAGTREVGGEARYKWTGNITLNGQLYREDVLATGSQRELAEADAQIRASKLTTLLGLRSVKDEIETAGVDAGGDSKQVLAGAAYDLMNKQVTLRAKVEQSLGAADSIDFPNRYLLGADYKLSSLTTAFIEAEADRGAQLSTDLLRVGLRTTPWAGAELRTSVGDQVEDDSARLFSSLGLTQKWQINKHWQADFTVDRGETVKDDAATPFNVNVPSASGPLNDSYTTVAAGSGYTNGNWSANGRVERRVSDLGDRFNILAHLDRKLDADQSVAAGLIYTDTSALGTVTRNLDARAGWALRPMDGVWMWLDRLDFITQTLMSTSDDSSAHKVVNNLNANLRPSRLTQWSFQYGEKYVFDRFGGADYNGFTDLLGIEVRHDLSQKWDIGASGSNLHSWSSRTTGYSLGASLGYSLVSNVWVAVGYNVLGFNDRDFGAAQYHARGFYLNLRAKFDQDTFGLNGHVTTETP
jgi:uncharacterized repeat protein (TIGR01451 family)